jgi:hypothetical protein
LELVVFVPASLFSNNLISGSSIEKVAPLPLPGLAARIEPGIYSTEMTLIILAVAMNTLQ